MPARSTLRRFWLKKRGRNSIRSRKEGTYWFFSIEIIMVVGYSFHLSSASKQLTFKDLRMGPPWRNTGTSRVQTFHYIYKPRTCLWLARRREGGRFLRLFLRTSFCGRLGFSGQPATTDPDVLNSLFKSLIFRTWATAGRYVPLLLQRTTMYSILFLTTD